MRQEREDQRRGGGELRVTGGGSEQGVKYLGNIVISVCGHVVVMVVITIMSSSVG